MRRFLLTLALLFSSGGIVGSFLTAQSYVAYKQVVAPARTQLELSQASRHHLLSRAQIAARLSLITAKPPTLQYTIGTEPYRRYKEFQERSVIVIIAILVGFTAHYVANRVLKKLQPDF